MNSAKAFIVLTLCFGLYGCSKNNKPPSKAEVVGTYKGADNNQTNHCIIETFVIREDGTFSQTVQRGTNVIYTSPGKWTLEQTNSIIFKPFFMRKSRSGSGSDMTLQVGVGAWTRIPIIHIDLGPWPYFVTKTSGVGAYKN